MTHEAASAGPTRPTGARSRRRELIIALLLGTLAFLVYNANLRSIPAGDTYAARYLPFSILQNGSLLLDPIVDQVAHGRMPPGVAGKPATAFWIMTGRDAHFVSLYPVAVPLVIAPLYLPALLYLDAGDGDALRADRVARIMEKLSASLMAAASVALIYLLLRRRANQRTAVLLALAYAFGTTTWVISSQALWQHGLPQLAIVAVLLLLTGPVGSARVVLAGLLCGLIAASRPPDAVLAAGLGIFGLWWAGRRWPLLAISALFPACLTLAYNLLVAGHWTGAYAAVDHPGSYNQDMLEGIAGLLFSPLRGLFIFSPFLLFVPCCFFLALRERRTRALTLAAAAAMALLVVGYSMVDWRQGVSWGPRWLTDLVPLLVWMLPPILAALRRPGRLLFALACAVAIAIEAFGAFWYSGTSYSAAMNADPLHPTAPFWQFANAPFIAELGQPRAPADLLMMVEGQVDRARIVAGANGEGADGGGDLRLVITGWALADRRTPYAVLAMLDGRFLANTKSFQPRPGVARALGVDAPAGWRIEVPAGDLQAGDHVVTVLVHGYAQDEPRLLGSASVTVPKAGIGTELAGPLAGAAQRAEQTLAAHLQPAGYWLTAFTQAPRYEQPRPEMNTFLNATLLELAAPAARTPALVDALARVRTFLAAQIEPGGLVRYHGRSDAPTIGVLGCAITPDSDDTALVWRLAPGKDPGELHAALATITQYRRPDGLYRTWLAPQGDYECIDPGIDPNPADIGIQMNLMLLLLESNAAAARDLCEAIRHKTGDAAVWVYYAEAPLMIVLRQADLAARGCALDLPPARLVSELPGQAIWIELAGVLSQAEGGVGTADTLAAAMALLRRIAADAFALLATTPPLVYHNDLTASVRRYYWSEDLGYALWLRLYQASWRLAAALP